MLNKKFYSDDNWMSFEIENIFKKEWIYVCLKSECSNNNDFITFNIFGHSIIIQNFNGHLAAFQNICSHRFKRIQTEEIGNRPLVCQYHGWKYNIDGVPRVPKRETFIDGELSCKKLTKYKLEICGEFVFVNLDKSNNTSLIDYLGGFYNDLMLLSSHIGRKIGEEKILHNANWKLLVENVLEGYHCPLVHKETLVKGGYCRTYPDNIKFDYGHSSWHSPQKENITDQKFKKKLNFLDVKTLQHNSFYHIYIFPNLFLSSTSGNLFYLGRLNLLKTNKSELFANFYSPKYSRELTVKEKTIERAFNILNFEAGIKVILEDKPMLESCQEGLTEISLQTGILSVKEEIRIIEFHKFLSSIYRNE